MWIFYRRDYFHYGLSVIWILLLQCLPTKSANKLKNDSESGKAIKRERETIGAHVCARHCTVRISACCCHGAADIHACYYCHTCSKTELYTQLIWIIVCVCMFCARVSFSSAYSIEYRPESKNVIVPVSDWSGVSIDLCERYSYRLCVWAVVIFPRPNTVGWTVFFPSIQCRSVASSDDDCTVFRNFFSLRTHAVGYSNVYLFGQCVFVLCRFSVSAA